ncbi:MAG: fatty acid desaturase [Kastovskya adunca ATA6-11-RM4]|jgi:fatty acid desaturase|nr:fatty acid desaturase [Kastovskya adunca ATA6-11-RM4]
MTLESSAIRTTNEARKAISAGIEAEIRALHQIKPQQQLIYVLYPLLAVMGVVVELDAYGRGLGWNLASVQYGVGVVVVALAMNAMFLLIHEAVHGVLSGRSWINHSVAVVLGIAGGVSFYAYRVMHLRHHEYLGDENDPDDYHNYTQNPTLVWLLHYNRLLWATLLYLIFVPKLAWRYGNRGDRINIITEYFLLGLFYTVLFLFVPIKVFAIVWLVPFLLANFMINLRGLTQHGITDATDPFIASRTVEANSVTRFLLLNENFHFEHHLFPGVPSSNLLRLHQLINQRLPRRVSCPSYSSFLFQFIRASLRQDESPIGFKELHSPQKT